MAQAIRDIPATELDSRGLTLRYWGYHQHHRPEEHALLRAAFESLVACEPDAADAWASFAHLYVHEHGFGSTRRRIRSDAPSALRDGRSTLMPPVSLGGMRWQRRISSST
jgi:hypothetical protein